MGRRLQWICLWITVGGVAVRLGALLLSGADRSLRDLAAAHWPDVAIASAGLGAQGLLLVLSAPKK